MNFFLDFYGLPCYPGVGKGHRSSSVAEVHVKRSVILIHRLVLFCPDCEWKDKCCIVCAHLKVPGWSSALSTLLTRKFPMFLSRLNEINGGCEESLPVSLSFCNESFRSWPPSEFSTLQRINVTYKLRNKFHETLKLSPPPLPLLATDKSVARRVDVVVTFCTCFCNLYRATIFIPLQGMLTA